MACDLRLLIYQGPSPAGNVEAAFASVARGLAVAAAAGADMAMFPELFLPGYNFSRIADLAQPANGVWEQRLAEMVAASGCGLTIGLAERDGTQIYNTALAIGGDGVILARYRKIQLYGPREAALFTPGPGHAVFELRGRKVALLICYEIDFAPPIRALSEQGVSLILAPTANMDPFSHVARLTVPAQAVNHALAIAYANYCGTEGDLTYCGGSVLVGADGAVAAQAGRGEAWLVADLPEPDTALLTTQIQDLRPL